MTVTRRTSWALVSSWHWDMTFVCPTSTPPLTRPSLSSVNSSLYLPGISDSYFPKLALLQVFTVLNNVQLVLNRIRTTRWVYNVIFGFIKIVGHTVQKFMRNVVKSHKYSSYSEVLERALLTTKFWLPVTRKILG